MSGLQPWYEEVELLREALRDGGVVYQDISVSPGEGYEATWVSVSVAFKTEERGTLHSLREDARADGVSGNWRRLAAMAVRAMRLRFEAREWERRSAEASP